MRCRPRSLTPPCSTRPLSCRCGLTEAQVSGHREGCPPLHTELSQARPRSIPRPSVTFAFTGQNAAAGPDGGRDGRGAPAPPPGGTVTPQGSSGWAGSWAGRRCAVTLCLLPAEHPGRHGDHLAAAGPGRAVEGRGRGCAPSHGRLSCPAGHLRLCQGLGAGATGEGPGAPAPTQKHRNEEGYPPSFSLSESESQSDISS